MCIRDSENMLESMAVMGGPWFGWLLALPFYAMELLVGVVPVSYTHLRAHETVLDLVCRLLLEQKKRHT